MPVMSHAYAEADGKPQRVVPGSIGLGLAVDVERKDGSRSLVVPVIAGAERARLRRLRRRATTSSSPARATTRCRRTPTPAPTSRLTNPGGIGTVASVPRLMPGQGTIVATGAIGCPPGLAGADPARLAELGVEKVMTMTSTYDHRVIQGAESGAFLRRIDELLQGVDGFYEEVFTGAGVELEQATRPTRRDGRRARPGDRRRP